MVPDGDARRRALAAALARATDGEVRFGAGDRALYATDASNYRQVPLGVVLPREPAELPDILAACREHEAPVTHRAGGTSLAGQSCNEAVIIDLSKYCNRILALDPDTRRARVQPGVVLDQLRAAAEVHHLTFGPDPATHSHNGLGGMIGNNSCGIHSVMAGRTADNVHRLEVVTYDGTQLSAGPTPPAALAREVEQGGRRGRIYADLARLSARHAALIRERYPHIPRRVSGYNLDELLPERGCHLGRALVGSEGTCVSVLEAELALVHSPPARCLLVLGYPDVFAAGDHVPEVLAAGPIGLEGIDARLVDYMRRKSLHPEDLHLLPEGGGWLLVEFGGESAAEAQDRARGLMHRLRGQRGAPRMKLYRDPAEAARVWEIRESGLGATARVPGMADTWPGWEDAAVPPAAVGDYLREFRSLLTRFDYDCSLYGHFGDGCIHVRIDFDLASAKGIARYRDFTAAAADLVVRHGGSLSGEHGDGQARADLLETMFGPELVGLFREFKRIWDPDNRMNPGKIVDPYPRDANLRLGPDYRPPLLATRFAFRDDGGDFARAATRCVGVGKCRRPTGGVMCPSYRVTREEQHSTRGRARLLFEMVNGPHKGGPLQDGWRDQAVREALDLCLACKGCKRDCPVDVDMASYKAEFMSHYYEGRLRPPAAYAMGQINRWSRLASLLPRTTNAALHAPGLAALLKRVGGIHPQRDLPRYARHTFRRWFNSRAAPPTDGPEVMLWPDTFHNYFDVEVAQAAVRVLEAAGYRVLIPDRLLCCGRPLYDWGWLDAARGLLEQTLASLAPTLRRGVPVIGLEPACLSTFKDELPNLLPDDARAQALAAQSQLLDTFLAGSGWRPPQLARQALVHHHCHHHALLDPGAEQHLLRAAGLSLDVLDAGCCGMAGSFGFEREHYAVAQACGEQVLLPAVREAAEDTLIVTDGFSCREQIRQGTGRRAQHVAQVLDLALAADQAAGEGSAADRDGRQR